MTATTTRRLDDLNLELRGLLLTRALLELRGFTPAQLDAHEHRTTRVRAELAGLGAAPSNEGGTEGSTLVSSTTRREVVDARGRLARAVRDHA